MSAIDAVIHAMELRPLTFKADDHTLTDTVSGIEYWTYLGYGVFSPAKFTFGIIDQVRFHFALKRWRKAWLTAKTEGKEPTR